MGKWGDAGEGAAAGAAAGSVAGPYGAAAGALIGGGIGYFTSDDGKAKKDEARFREAVAGQGFAADRFAGYGEQGFQQRGDQWNMDMERMRAIAEGRVSHSSEQLRQGLQQNMAQQQAMAAGARGGNQAMAARQASMNAARAGSGLAGQTAIAGIQERNQASAALMQAQAAARDQDLRAALGARGQAIQGYGTVLGNPGQNNGADPYLQAGAAAAQYYAMNKRNG